MQYRGACQEQTHEYLLFTYSVISYLYVAKFAFRYETSAR